MTPEDSEALAQLAAVSLGLGALSGLAFGIFIGVGIELLQWVVFKIGNALRRRRNRHWLEAGLPEGVRGPAFGPRDAAL